jgi:uncharacterized protein (DUF2141 family)
MRTAFKRNISLFVSALLAAAALSVPARGAESTSPGATVVIRVENVAPQGMVRLGLYSEKLYPDDNADPAASADVPASAGETVVTFQNIPVGTYAVEVYQDLNSNGKMDTDFLGIPREPYGFSRDARPLLSKPDFDRVKFEVTAGQNGQTLHLQNTATRTAAN